MPTAARLICVIAQQFTSGARDWEIMLHQFPQLSVEIPNGVKARRDTDSGRSAREACVRVLHPTFAIAFRDASRDTLQRQDRGPHARRNTPARGNGSERSKPTFTYLHRGVMASRALSVMHLSRGPGLTSLRNFPGELSLPSLTYYLSNHHATANFFAEV